MPLPHRIARFPLRVVHRVVGGERYQDVILPYWPTLLRIQDVALAGRFRRRGATTDPASVSDDDGDGL